MLNIRRGLSAAAYVVVLGSIVYICSFKVLDRDFWWHIKDGEMMLQTQSLIHSDIFAYTRWQKPYLATHEWLAQIVLYLVHHYSGFNGVIVFRTIMMAATLTILLLIDTPQIWFNGFLAILAANSLKRGFIERPQLFTYILFAAFIWLAYKYLEEPPEQVARRKRILWAYVGLEVLWVNFHGAACLMGIGIVGALMLQEALNGHRSGGITQRAQFMGSAKALIITLGGMLVAFFISPNTYRNFTYLSSLMGDKTIAFIGEWQPRDMSIYIRELGPFWVLGCLGLAVGRRARLFSFLVFASMGYLSMKAFRHEMLFVIAATGTLIFQLKYSPLARKTMDLVLSRWKLSIPAYALTLVLLGQYVRADYFSFCQKDHLFGYGVFDLAKGTLNFLNRENIRGNMFNTDGIGGYLTYAGYPYRPIYMDGRNVDFGFELMYKTYFAGEHPELWQELDERYHFTYALIDYDAIKRQDKPLMYINHLAHNPNWKLVYTDDWAAVYLKNIPMNRRVIEKDELHWATPEHFEDRAWAETVDPKDFGQVERELLRMVAENPDGVKPRLALARLSIRMGKKDQARQMLEDSKQHQPYRAEIYEVLASLALAEQRWSDAGRAYETMIRYAGAMYPNINYAYIASVFDKAGEFNKAEKYWKKAGPGARVPMAEPSSTPAQSPSPSPSPTSASPSQPVSAPPESTHHAPPAEDVLPATAFPKKEVDAKTKALTERLSHDLQEGLAEDLKGYLDKGVDLAQQGKPVEARHQFEEALKIDPGNPDTLNDLGSTYYQEKRWEEAIPYYRRAIERYPEFAEAHYNLARTYFHLGRLDEARGEAQAGITLGPQARALIEKIDRAKKP